MIAYDAVSVLADQIVADTKAKIKSQTGAGCTATTKGLFLADSAAQSQMSAFFSFKTSVAALTQGYQSLGPGGSGPLAVAPTDWISTVTSFLSALRNTATYSGQTFTPDDTVLATLLASKFAPDYQLASAQHPGNINQAAVDISELLKKLTEARSHVPAAQQTDLFKSLDQQWNSLQTSLAGTDSNGNNVLTSVINGQALVSSLGNCYPQLTAKTIAAGGSIRTNHNFWVELFYTTPKPSYNGGAIVAYSVYAGDNSYLTGSTIRYIYDYSIWSPSKISNYKNF
jgi:hypothetical protein